MLDKSVKDYWPKIMPEFNPRPSQMETFEWMDNLDPSTKYILLEMPVGGGKSPVGLTMSSWLSGTSYGSSFILTPQKILQKQYEDSFNKQILRSMYGKSNYTCRGKNTNCEVGETIKPPCGSNCAYKIALNFAISSSNLVLNYKLGLLYFEYLMHFDNAPFKPRKLLVMDECHNLEQHLISNTETVFSKFMCEKMNLPIKFKMPNSLEDAKEWISTDYFRSVESYFSELDAEVERLLERSQVADPFIERKVNERTRVSRHIDLIHRFLLTYERSENPNEVFVFVPDYNKFAIKELYARNAFNSIIKPAAEKFLFMSSTILNKREFCDDLGINPDNAEMLSLTSEFEIERRPIIYAPKCKMSYGWDNNERRTGRKKMIDGVINILDLHKNDSGIIHTSSFKISQWLIEEISTHTGHYILNHNPIEDKKISRDDIIAEYIRSAKDRPTVLISPSITEGLDLKDDLGRFAIFAKVPFPSLGDAWIKRRMQLSKGWYNRQALIEMIQGSGRVCRSEEDWGITYILDESFGYLYNVTRRNYIPDWWDEGLEFV